MSEIKNFRNLERLFNKLFPINRSITGNGYNESLKILKRYVPFKIKKYHSGKKVFDWVVPLEWNISEAYIENSCGKKILDFKKNNLHVLNYSVSVNKTINLNNLNKKLHSLPDQPNAIPYVTSYYKKNWGFCMSHNQRLALKKENYKVIINTTHKKGYVRWGEFFLKKNYNDKSLKKDTILITSYLCHPSMANNELSGPLILTLLYERIKKWKKRKYNYLFVINPETIGSICFIHNNYKFLKNNIQCGLVLTCLGGPEKKLSYKLSRKSNSTLDRFFTSLSKKKQIRIREFDTSGSDERQYCSSELNLPIGQIGRTLYGDYKEYHTSNDNKEFVILKNFISTANEISGYFKNFENRQLLKRVQPFCELQLGKRDLYPNLNSPLTWKNSTDIKIDKKAQLQIISEILSYADGETYLDELKVYRKFEKSYIKSIYKKLKLMKLIY